MKKSVLALMIGGVFILGAGNAAQASEAWYAGLGLPHISIGGDFDGERAFAGPSNSIIVPEIDGALGLEFFGGYRGSTDLGVEFKLTRSKHDATWMGSDFDVNYLSVNVNLKLFFGIKDEAIQPYLIGGGGFHQLEVVDGSDGGGNVGDAVYTGLGLNLGMGVDYFVYTNFSFGVGLLFRVVSYDKAKGVIGGGELEDTLSGNSFGLFFRSSYHFVKKPKSQNN